MKVTFTLLLPIILIGSLFSFPITEYDFHLPNTNISPFSSGLGGICLTNSDNNFALSENPALLSDIKQMNFSASFAIPSKEKSFVEIMKTNPILQKSVFRGLSIQAQRVGFLYQELANDKFTKKDSLDKFYQDYKLRAFSLSIADTTKNISWGLSLKYLNGRLVYLKERKAGLINETDSVYVKEEFIDSKAQGFASDLGIYGKKSGFLYGFVVYDLFSKLYWKDYDQAKIKTRGSFSAELRSENISIASSVTSLWNIHEKPIYCQSINYDTSLANPNLKQSFSFRFGSTSKDYKKSENILFSFGTSYMIQTFKIDLSMQTQGLKTNTAQYAFSISIGE